MPPNNFSVTEATADSQTIPYKSNDDMQALTKRNKNQLNEARDINGNVVESEKATNDSERKIEPAWFNIFGFIVLHYVTIFEASRLVHWDKTAAFSLLMGVMTGLGITAGAHRLWAHGAYKANRGLKIFLLICQTIAFQNSVIEWVRDHRVHHKFTDTNADPHNASRGFFFSHMGWLMCKKHPDVKKFGAKVSLTDLESDPLLAFQHKYFVFVMPLFCFGLPTLIPWYFWGESAVNALVICGIARYTLVLHITWLINSAAHMWGTKPYDKSIRPVDTYTVSTIAFGEGFHNYHHVFPWDYKTAELGLYWCNMSTCFLDGCAKMGWATDLKTVPMEMVRKRVMRTGDGSHDFSTASSENVNSDESQRDVEHFWGWNDETLTEEDKKGFTIINRTQD